MSRPEVAVRKHVAISGLIGTLLGTVVGTLAAIGPLADYVGAPLFAFTIILAFITTLALYPIYYMVSRAPPKRLFLEVFFAKLIVLWAISTIVYDALKIAGLR